MVTQSGCGAALTNAANKEIQLIEPVSAEATTQKAAKRDLYDYEIINGCVYPQITEYAFEQNIFMKNYMVIPGQQIKPGDVLVKGDITDVENQISQLKDRIEADQEGYSAATSGLREEIRKLNEQIAAAQNENDKNDLAKQLKGLELQLEQQTELYNLDQNYLIESKKALESRETTYELCALSAGEVVNYPLLNMLNTPVNANTPLVAVADNSVKVIKCEYISSARINGCADIYALIGGKRYEITYQPCSPEKYDSITEKGDKVYTTFEIEGADEVSAGEQVQIVLLAKAGHNVLSVLKSSIHKDTSGHYVYEERDGEKIAVPVRIGMTDGVYTEITAGLEEGEEILLDDYASKGTKTVEVERGDMVKEYNSAGYITYPSIEVQPNQIENGKVTFLKYDIDMFQQVEKGDVIAEVAVEVDEATLYEKQQELKRQQDRLNALSQEKDVKEDDKKPYRKRIAELQEEISELQRDAATTQITANASGIVVWMPDIKKNSELYSKQTMAQIADNDKCLLAVDNSNGQLNYGNQVEVTYNKADGSETKVVGTVVMAGAMGMSTALTNNQCCISIPQGAMEEMRMAESDGNMTSRKSYDIKCRIKDLKNIIKVPKNAVNEIAGRTYVSVIEKNGEIIDRAFISGGSDGEYYWAIEGLEEGMKLCSK